MLTYGLKCINWTHHYNAKHLQNWCSDARNDLWETRRRNTTKSVNLVTKTQIRLFKNNEYFQMFVATQRIFFRLSFSIFTKVINNYVPSEASLLQIHFIRKCIKLCEFTYCCMIVWLFIYNLRLVNFMQL